MAGKIFKAFFKVTTILLSILLLVGAGLVAMLAFPVFGNQALIVRSGSMEPGIPVGSVVVVRPAENNVYNVDDVIAFNYDEDTIVTHRIAAIENGAEGVVYSTKGDANEEVDGWTVAPSQILGKNYFTLPEFGKVLAFARSERGFPLLIILPGILVILLEAISIFRELRKKVKENKQKKDTQNNPKLFFYEFGFQRLTDTGHNFNGLKMLLPIFALGLSIQTTSAFFSDTESSVNNYFQAAAAFGTPTPSPTPTPSDDPCAAYIDISNNGPFSTNIAYLICKIKESVKQKNTVNVDTDVEILNDTGNNSSSGNTNGDNTVQSGSSSATVEIDVEGGVNQNGPNTTPSPTPTPTSIP